MKAREEMPLLRCALGPYGPPLRGRAALRNGIRNRWPQGHHNTELGHGRFHLKKADPWSKNGGRRIKVVFMPETLICYGVTDESPVT